MIIPMKKTTLFCMASEKEQALERMRDLGVVHVKHVRPPAAQAIDEARRRLREIQRALELVPKTVAKPIAGMSAEDAVLRVHALFRRRKELGDEIEKLRQEEKALAPFGNFNPEAAVALAGAGVPVKLYHAPAATQVEAPGGAALLELGKANNNVFFCVAGEHESAQGWREFPMPGKSLEQTRAMISETLVKAGEAEEELRELAASRDAIARLETKTLEEVEFLETSESIGLSGEVIYLQGFCPEHEVRKLEKAAVENGWGISVSDPSPEDNPPTLLKNPEWVKPINAVFQFMSLTPGYREFDISPVFLLFFSLFFAMLVGDAGYGALMIALTFWGRKKLPKVPKPAFTLMFILSISTVVWGVITGTYFGIDIGLLPTPLKAMTVEWLTTRGNVMSLCFLIGAIHLTIAYLWNISRILNSPRALAQAGWLIVIWMMYFLARSLILSKPMYPWIGVGIALGVGLIAVFMTPLAMIKKEWYNHMLLPLNVISGFVDVVSYLRLFAVGYASLAVASSFNNMASSMFGTVLGGLAGALVLFVGHALNIAMALLGVIVHGIRLNTLEFSTKLGMEWAGMPYNPFARRLAAGPDVKDVSNAADQTQEKTQ